MSIKIIGVEDETFYRMVEEAVSRIRDQLKKEPDKWIDGEEAMHLLRITSRTTLQKFRDEGKIIYSQLEKKLILYDRDSILAFIEKNKKNIF